MADDRATFSSVPPPERSYTDPFVVGHGDQTFVFFEVLEHRRAARGQLAVGRLEADSRLADVKPVLPSPHHTSYPYVFRDGGPHLPHPRDRRRPPGAAVRGDELPARVGTGRDAARGRQSRWTPLSNLRRARPAGRPFVLGDRLIRPSQDCSRRYGASVVFNQVDVLTVDDYREHPVASLEPRWADRPNLAAHAYTFDAGWEATDGLHTFPAR